MLKWSKHTKKNQSGTPVSESLGAELPSWGEASIHTHIHYPGEVFLRCSGLGIDMHSLGKLTLEEAVKPAEEMMTKTLERYAVSCRKGLEALRGE